jgi:ectoine hydroxylase-related dioxygenase (phytanoyl-CoA dioxygenase family)
MKQLQEEGFAILPNILTNPDIETITQLIDEADTNNPNFRRSKDLFAIRQFIRQIPEMAEIILQSGLSDISKRHFGEDYFIVKSIYFDKPPASNWFVSYHQDLTISVKEKIPTGGFGPWTTKEGQFAVQPTINILEDNITVRIHLDDTTADNGALKVVPGSHLKGIFRPETIDWSMEREVTCEVHHPRTTTDRPRKS